MTQGEQRSADVHGDRFGLSALRHRARGFSVFEIKFDFDTSLTHPPMLQEQSAFLDRRDVHDLAESWRLSRFRRDPVSSVFFNLRGRRDWNRLTLHGDRKSTR